MKKSILKKASLFIVIFLTVTALRAQTYTWMKGSNLSGQSGIYGVSGVAAPNNNPGGREGAASWKDAAGNFWLFGGLGYDVQGNYDYLNDIWKYTVSTNQWTWIGGDSIVYQNGVYGTMGTPAPTNKPGSRYGAVTWTDGLGNLWMLGGEGLDGAGNTGEMNDLWKYNTGTNQWTWMRGSSVTGPLAVYGTQGTAAPTNEPGGTFIATSWTDASGNLWLFGGQGDDASNYGDLNDLWKYTISTNQWTWMKGSGIVDQNGIYGTVSVPAGGNLQGGRLGATGWADASGNLWLTGGFGYDATNSGADFLNDLWKYSIGTNQWTWVKGSNTSGQLGVYGTQGTAGSTNVPGARAGSVSWIDPSSGLAYLFGGFGYNALFSMNDHNDLWLYSSTTNHWTWQKGGNSVPQNGIYGTQGTPATVNTPGARSLSARWTDNMNNLWLFGGTGLAASGSSSDDLNDLWKLSNCVAPTLTVTASQSTICSGQSSTITAAGAVTYLWSNSLTTPSVSVAPTTTSVYVVTGSSASGCSVSVSYTVNVSAAPIITVTNSHTVACVGGTAALTASGASGLSWSNGDSGPTSIVTYTNAGQFTISTTGANTFGCPGSSMYSITVNPSPTVTTTSSKPASCPGETVTLTAGGATSYTWNSPVSQNPSVSVSPALTTTYTVTGTDANGCKNTFAFTQTVNTCVGLKDPGGMGNALNIYPNPSAGQFSIRTSVFENAELAIFNALGQKVYEQGLTSENTQIQVTLEKGIYIYQLMRGDTKVATGKLVIE